jgi:hypothetical protein
MYMYMSPIPNGFRDKAVSLYSIKIVDKKDTLRAVTNINSVASVHKRTIPTERPPLVGKVTARSTAACRRSYCQLLRIEGVAWSAQRISTAFNLGFLYPAVTNTSIYC